MPIILPPSSHRFIIIIIIIIVIFIVIFIDIIIILPLERKLQMSTDINLVRKCNRIIFCRRSSPLSLAPKTFTKYSGGVRQHFVKVIIIMID